MGAVLFPAILALVLWGMIPSPNLPAQETPPEGVPADQPPAQSSQAEEPIDREDRGRHVKGRWVYTVAAYGWLADTDADITLKGQTVSVDLPFKDALDYLDFGGFAYVEANNDKWFFYFDASYLAMSEDEKFKSTMQGDPPVRIESDVEVNLSMAFLEAGAGHRLFEHVLHKDEEGKDRRRITLDAYAGARYYNMYTRLYTKLDAFEEPPGGPSTPVGSTTIRGAETEEWVDPLVGLRTKIDLLRDLSFRARGDVGGFDVGSDLAWKARLLLDYAFTERFSIAGGYQWLDIDYDNAKSGSRKFAFDGQFRGPVLGLAYKF